MYVAATVSSQVLYKIGLFFTIYLYDIFQYDFYIGQELERFQRWYLTTRYDMIQLIILMWTLHRHDIQKWNLQKLIVEL